MKKMELYQQVLDEMQLSVGMATPQRSLAQQPLSLPVVRYNTVYLYSALNSASRYPEALGNKASAA